jgi:hypothetical protein
VLLIRIEGGLKYVFSVEESVAKETQHFLPFKEGKRVSSLSPAYHRGAPDSITGQPTWDLWWKKCDWKRSFSECFNCAVSFIPSILSTHIQRHAAATRKTNGRHGEALENNPLPEIGEYWMETIFLEVQNEVEVSQKIFLIRRKIQAYVTVE